MPLPIPPLMKRIPWPPKRKIEVAGAKPAQQNATIMPVLDVRGEPPLKQVS